MCEMDENVPLAILRRHFHAKKAICTANMIRIKEEKQINRRKVMINGIVVEKQQAVRIDEKRNKVLMI